MRFKLPALNVQSLATLLSLVLIFSVNEIKAQDGEKLFKSFCAACHSPGTAKLVGPGLAGINEKYDKEWLHAWIKNSTELINAGDPDAVKIFNEYNKLVMPPQPVNDEEIDAILAYIDAQAAAAPSTTEGALGTSPTGTAAAAGDENETAQVWIMIGVIALLFVIIVALRKISHSMRTVLSERAGEEPPKERSFWQSVSDAANKNMTVVVLLIIVAVVFVLKLGWNALLGIGVYEGYQPEQPILFSHELHAGQNGIDCNYCHTSASFSKTAGIPSPSLCMNCHTYIQEGPQYGTTEIAKIYEALDYDPVTQTYGDNIKPIKWVKVHNLPDHVYFNHSQHVTVGKIECQECHGPVETYTVGMQSEPLTMGWCIDCHRTTAVKMEGNGYYDEIHARLPEHFKEQYLKDGSITVSELGGIECAKCHY